MLADLVVVVGAYLLGSIPFAHIFTRAFSGRDVRYDGEGNVGSRNAAYLAGRWAGILTAIADIGKGTIVYYVARQFASTELIMWLAGAAVTIGHCYPIFLRFRGGKGLSPVTGFLLPIYPLSFISSSVVFYLVYRLSHSFDLMSTVGIVTLIVATLIEGGHLGRSGLAAALFGLTGIKAFLDRGHTAKVKAASGWRDDAFALVRPEAPTEERR